MKNFKLLNFYIQFYISTGGSQIAHPKVHGVCMDGWTAQPGGSVVIPLYFHYEI